MANYEKEVGVTDHHETELDHKTIGNALPEHVAVFSKFSHKDEEWHAYMEKKLLRKVDIRLLPVLILMYLLNFLDRSNLAQARLGSLEKDLGMKGTDFNVCTSILFVGYILMQLPSNMLLTRVKPSIYLGTVMTIWGAISAAQAGTTTYAHMVICRFFLGVMEAPFFPGSIFLLSSWYKRSELAHRLAFFYAGSAVANMFGSLLAAGVLGNLNGAHGISGWRWLFIIEGVITIGVAMMAVFILPNYPATTKWLTEEERNYAQWRLLVDAKEEDNQTGASVLEGVKWAFKDYRIYFFIFLQHLNLLTQSFTYFFPTIVKTLGYNRTQTLLLTVPVWFGTLLSTIVVSYSSSRLNERAFHIAGAMLVSCLGNIIVTSTVNVPARFVGMFLMPMGALPAFQIILTWIANSFPRPLVKRSAAIAACNMLGNLANIYGPYMYQATDGPRYIPGGSATAVAAFTTAMLAVAIRFILVKENKKLEEAENEGQVEPSERVGDVRAFGFRYIL